MKCQFFFAVLFFQSLLAFAGKEDPEIKGQRPLVTDAGKSITIQLSDLIVDPKKSRYPNGFFVEIFDGDHYSHSGSTVTPEANFSGTLEVHVRVSDGDRHSKKFNLKITV